MRTYVILIVSLILSLGCARVRVEAPKEAIKVDISMRMDIYQHVEKDIDAVENIVSSPKETPKAGSADNHSMLEYFMTTAYAQDENFSPEVKEAALRRRDRRPQLSPWKKEGAVGENRTGMVVVVKKDKSSLALEQLVNAENADRMIIYHAIAKKNGTSVGEVQQLYAKRMQAHVPSGTPIEVQNANGSYEWKVK